MLPTFARRAQFGAQFDGTGGLQPWRQKPSYETFKSQYGPKYKVAPNFHGISAGRAVRFGITASGFGVVAGAVALFFLNDVPRVRHDILEKVPFIGGFYHKEVAPEDNPF
ncbi:hypothetical protein K431DRAFT_243804 [Polychaeton citri CBS 116435]|uniref:Cytochrome b-c1 complex subunit 10 n=1 Tax=Polychaeton citri CBS 116435 TaxID=1314669 RepID=A0A9P4QBK9_9PEZI|nr:hypothetical protein K431DRAFT_243804 [Polychaeton citri CBS 116435]